MKQMDAMLDNKVLTTHTHTRRSRTIGRSGFALYLKKPQIIHEVVNAVMSET